MSLIIETPQDTNKSINCKGKTINLDKAIVMGILNLTPDSFFDGGRYQHENKVMEQVNSMEYDGATIIDIGGYSTRPQATHITEEEELKRVLPIIKLIKSNFKELTISIDTFRGNVARKCVEFGADIINDISGATLDLNMFDVVTELNVPYVLTHIKGTPQNMQDNPSYTDILEEVKTYFKEKIDVLNAKGFNNIIIDPGFGFGKTVDHNYKLLGQLNDLNSLGYPILSGVSRKSMINKVLNTTPEEALNGTTVLNTIALQKGAKILRVHDVKEAQETIQLVGKLH